MTDRAGMRRVWLLGIGVAMAAAGCSAGGDGPSAGAARSTIAAAPVPPTSAGTPVDASAPPDLQTAPLAPAPVAPSPPPTPPPASGSLVPLAVRSVTDGDTLVLADGRRVRLAQVDAPETNECFGSQSTQALRTLVEGRMVTVRRPSNGPELDRFGRTVAEVSVEDHSVNEQLVRDGAAEWYQEFAREDAGLAGRLGAAEADAKRASRGLWSGCPTAAPASAAPSRAVAPSGGSCHPGYPDDCIPPGPPDLDCPDIGHRVRVDQSRGDPHRFDADRDGWGCESYG